jgi:hypothetical protein
MSRFICCVLFLSICTAAFSQKVYFIYLQSEAEQPFFVKTGEKTYNSSSAGYLILSQLKDSTYNIKVGFPQNKWPDQQFLVSIKSKDHGYLLKNFGEKGWGLFDLQTMGIQMAPENSAKASKKEFREVSAFTDILSKAANDPSLREKPVFAVAKTVEKVEDISPAVVKEEVNKPEKQPVNDSKSTVKPEEKTETNQQPIVLKEEKVAPAIKEQPGAESKAPLVQKDDSSVAKTEVQVKEMSPGTAIKQETTPQKDEVKTAPVAVYKKSIVIKKSESSTTDGFGLTFIDQYIDGQKDTIKIIIPNSKELLAKENEQQADEKKFLDIGEQTKENNLSSKVISKTNCSSVSSENDFLKLRKKMAGQKTEEAMTEEAKKIFKTKCFTTEQIKNLGNLFLNEAGKFQFYEAAYPYSSDKDNFTVLQTELKDNYFIHRFKNLVKPGSL